jgi:hypothetical protein
MRHVYCDCLFQFSPATTSHLIGIMQTFSLPSSSDVSGNLVLWCAAPSWFSFPFLCVFLCLCDAPQKYNAEIKENIRYPKNTVAELKRETHRNDEHPTPWIQISTKISSVRFPRLTENRSVIIQKIQILRNSEKPEKIG